MPTEKLFNQLDGLFANDLDFDSNLNSDEEDAYETTSLTSIEDDHNFMRNNSTKSNNTILSSRTTTTINTVSTDLSIDSTYTRDKGCGTFNSSPAVAQTGSIHSQKHAKVSEYVPLTERAYQAALTKSIKLHRHIHQQDANLNNILECLNDMTIQQNNILNQELQRIISEVQSSVAHNTHTIDNFRLQFNRVKTTNKC